MASRSRTLYIGVIGNLRKRVFKHRDGYDCEPENYHLAGSNGRLKSDCGSFRCASG